MARVLNLGFHGIGAPAGRDFGEGEREFWVSRRTFAAVLESAAGHGDVRLSFDDGNASDMALALPALLDLNLSATFFLVPSWVGTPGFITEADVRTLVEAGMTIGNHGLAHRRLTALAPTDFEHEVTEGRNRLERLAGTDIGTLAIPYGAYDGAVLEVLRGHGYEHVFTSDGGVADAAAWLQPREHVRAHHNVADLEGMLRRYG